MTKKEKQEIIESVCNELNLKEMISDGIEKYLSDNAVIVYDQPDYVDVQEVVNRLSVGTSNAYKIIQKLNAQLKANGYVTRAGMVPRAYFDERCYFKPKKMSLPTTNDEATN